MLKTIKRILNNQLQIMENQQILLDEAQKQYNPDRSVANKRHCDNIKAKISETAESIKLTCECWNK